MGYIDVKNHSEPVRKPEGVHFYVHQRCIKHKTKGIVVFDWVKINVGNGYNFSTGVFVAPKPGLYQFMFNAIKEDLTMDRLAIYLRVNDVGKGETATPTGIFSYPVSLHAMLKLKKGDRVDMYKNEGKLGCNGKDPNSHFSGSLLEEH